MIDPRAPIGYFVLGILTLSGVDYAVGKIKTHFERMERDQVYRQQYYAKQDQWVREATEPTKKLVESGKPWPIR